MNTRTVNPAGQSTAHLADDELLRFLDDDEDPQRTAWQGHVASCAHCAAEVESLRRDAQIVREFLELAAFEEATPGADQVTRHGTSDAAVIELADVTRRASGRRGRPKAWHSMAPWMRVAAVIALLATPVAAIPSLRQWVVTSVVGPAADAPVTTMSAPSPQRATTGVIRFVPSPGAFVVEVDVAQSAGELHVVRAAGGEAELHVGDADDAVPVVSAAVLRIRNGAGHTSSYTLHVPATVSSVTIRMSGRSTVLERLQIEAGATVSLR
ncbi:hypothetical protein BH23GEM9_BH23GEM9_12600 [soil metagenome]